MGGPATRNSAKSRMDDRVRDECLEMCGDCPQLADCRISQTNLDSHDEKLDHQRGRHRHSRTD